MLRIADRDLPATASAMLGLLQLTVDGVAGYPERVASAKQQWDQKTSTVAKANAFLSVRTTLDKMCIGPRRCAYCEDSLAAMAPRAIAMEQWTATWSRSSSEEKGSRSCRRRPELPGA